MEERKEAVAPVESGIELMVSRFTLQYEQLGRRAN